MTTPNDDPSLLEEWKEIEEELGKTEAYKVIAEEYNTTYSTVYYWLTRRPRRPRKRTGRYEREPYRREYDKDYKWFTRHLEQYLSQAFENKDTMELTKLSKKLAREAESDPKVGRAMHLQPETLQKRLEQLDDPPIVEIGDGIYRWVHKKKKKG